MNRSFLVCLCFGLFHERETPIVHSFLIWVNMLSSFPSVQTNIWWLARNLKPSNYVHSADSPKFLIWRGGGGSIRHWQPSSILHRRPEEFESKNKLTNSFLLNNKFRPHLWSGPTDLHVENYFLTWRVILIFYIYDALLVSF